VAHPSTSEAQRCDRQCLADFITPISRRWFAHDPERLHTSSRVRFTEDTVDIRLGQVGLWKTATALRPYRQDFLDVREGVAGTTTVVEENGNPVLLALRLKVFALAISEVETMVVRNKQEGVLFEPEGFTKPNAGMAYLICAGAESRRRLNDRDEKIASRAYRGPARGQVRHADVDVASYRFGRAGQGRGPGEEEKKMAGHRLLVHVQTPGFFFVRTFEPPGRFQLRGLPGVHVIIDRV
jgi:hypothetical protein